jgi:hypothetical protein
MRDQEDSDVIEIIRDGELKKQLNQLPHELGDSCRKIPELFYYENLSMK